MEKIASPDLQADIYQRVQSGQSYRVVAKALGVSTSTVSKYGSVPPPNILSTNKKVADFQWREWAELAKHAQRLRHKASGSQKFATVTLGDNCPVHILPFGDQHMGAIGADYDAFFRITEEIKTTPNLYVLLMGDPTEMAIKMRSVAEVCAQVFAPDKQERFFEDWLEEIKHRVIGSVWCNHAVERQEKQAGSSYIKRLMQDRFIYFDGIGHLDVKLGTQTYKFAISHKFRGYSYMNACHAGSRYMRFQGIDREIAIMGDIHTPAFMKYYDGEVERLSMVSGTLNTDSSYATRYFSLFTQAQFPVIQLHHKEHSFTPFKNLHDCLISKRK